MKICVLTDCIFIVAYYRDTAGMRHLKMYLSCENVVTQQAIITALSNIAESEMETILSISIL
jgi:hypothetical protein